MSAAAQSTPAENHLQLSFFGSFFGSLFEWDTGARLGALTAGEGAGAAWPPSVITTGSGKGCGLLYIADSLLRVIF